MIKQMVRTYSIILLCGLLATGCTPIGAAVGAGATVGIAAAQEGGLKQAATDAAIRMQIHDAWFKHNVDMYRYLDMTVKEGRVLVTGTVDNPDMRVDAIRLAWQAQGVRQVINEVNVDKKTGGVMGFMRDSFVTTKLKTKLTFDKDVQAINFTADTVNGTVYLMGVAQDVAERERVIDHARNMSYVQSVISYIRLRGENPPGVQRPTEKK